MGVASSSYTPTPKSGGNWNSNKWIHFKLHYISTDLITMLNRKGNKVTLMSADAKISVICRTEAKAELLLFDYLAFVVNDATVLESYNKHENTRQYIFEISELAMGERYGFTEGDTTLE
jgi:hypothetical protein